MVDGHYQGMTSPSHSDFPVRSYRVSSASQTTPGKAAAAISLAILFSTGAAQRPVRVEVGKWALWIY
jgi:hypothetical protein